MTLKRNKNISTDDRARCILSESMKITECNRVAKSSVAKFLSKTSRN